jgi:hypothetical protein
VTFVLCVHTDFTAVLQSTDDRVGSMMPKLLAYYMHASTGGKKRGPLYDDDFKRVCKEYVPVLTSPYLCCRTVMMACPPHPPARAMSIQPLR